MKTLLTSLLAAGILLGFSTETLGKDKKIVLIAGRPSHGPGDHEFRAGCLLLQKSLNQMKGIHAEVATNGWPTDNSIFEGASAVLMFMDGGGGHPLIKDNHLEVIRGLVKKGVGFGCAHYAVEIPKDKGGPELTEWIGGFYEDKWSTNPHWVAEIKSLPKHPITRGVKPFGVRDEWYYNIRLREGMKGVTPILVAKPDDETRQGKTSSPRGPYPHIVAASGREEILMWTVDNKGGNRGFGFTGGHFHKNWGDENFRKVFLNALLWIAHAEIPKDGAKSTVTSEELSLNLDPKGRK